MGFVHIYHKGFMWACGVVGLWGFAGCLAVLNRVLFGSNMMYKVDFWSWVCRVFKR